MLPVMAAIFDLSVIATSEGVHTSPAALLDFENVDIAFGISSLSRIEAEIMRYFTSAFG